MIDCRQLELAYGDVPVLSRVDLAVRPGERWFWIGPNGSGKSTLLRAILGLLRPRSGELQIDPDLADHTGVGYVPQRCEWTATLPSTVREFVSLGFVGVSRTRTERETSHAWALERVGLAGLAGASYSELSGGQRQRALVARALVRRPRLLILDEPTEELDVASEAALLDTLMDLNEQHGTSIVFVTHELELAARYATHVALFGDGVVQAGVRERLLEHERLTRAFGGRVPSGLAAAPPVGREERS
jgi:ABC-type Mn2+/Zn2+ transport system ATPase subunit